MNDTKQIPDVVGLIIEYESGLLSDKQILNLFACLIRSGTVWSLQGHYGRTASALIQDGWISQTGKILKKVY